MAELYAKAVKGKGRGVFSKTAIQPNEIIEICPLLIIPGCDYDLTLGSFIKQYVFSFDKEQKHISLPMGFGCLYNHNCPANAYHITDLEKKEIHIIAVTHIKPQEEITINYTGAFDDDSLVWFKERNIKFVK